MLSDPDPGRDPGRDPWLDPWLPLVIDSAAGAPVLEIGCGSGADTATLTDAGLQVLAFDLSADAIDRARQRVPGARFLVRDVRDQFPVGPGGTGVIVASLSLHYFAWAETLALFERVRHTLRPGGLLLCRLNSTDDVHFGAVGHEAIEPLFYRVDGQPKRFFDRASVDAVLATGWAVRSVVHKLTDKYLQPKAVWELVCTRADDPPSSP